MKILLLLIAISFFEVLIAQESNFKLLPSFGHTRRIQGMEMTTDGSKMVSISFESIKIWDIKTQKVIATLLDLPASGFSMALSSNNKYFVAGDSKGNVYVYSFKNFEILHKFKLPSSEYGVYSVTFSNDCKWVAASSASGSYKIWSVKDGIEMTGLPQTISENIMAVCFTNDDKYLILGSSFGYIYILDIETKNIVHSSRLYEEITNIKTIPNSDLIAVGASNNTTSDGYVIFVNPATGTKEKEFLAHDFSVNYISFTSDGKTMATTSNDRTTKLWDMATMEMKHRLIRHLLPVNAAHFTPDGKFIYTASADTRIIKWDVSTGKNLQDLGRLIAPCKSLAVSPDGKYAAVGYAYGVLLIWDMETGEFVTSLKKHNVDINSVDISPNGKLLVAGSADSSASVWETNTWQLRYHLDYYIKGQVGSVRFFPDNDRFITADWERECHIYSAESAGRLHNIECKAMVSSAVPSPIYNRVYIGDNTVRCYDLDKQKDYFNIDVYGNYWFDVYDISPDGNKMLTQGNSNDIDLWEISKKKPQRLLSLKGHTAGLRSVKFYNNGQSIISTSTDKTIRLWDLAGNNTNTFEGGHNSIIMGASLLPNNRMVSVSYDGTMAIWDVEKKEIITRSFTNWNTEEWITFTQDGYFMGSNNGGDMVVMVEGLNAFYVDQFASFTNRPDIILERLNPIANAEKINHFKKQYWKRLRKLGVESSELLAEVPKAKIESIEVIESKAKINATFSEKAHELKTYNIYINDVPLFGAQGKTITGKEAKITDNIDLTQGTNKIEIACFNTKGLESFRELQVVKTQNDVAKNLYLLALGVSTYKDASLNLAYAHKDALDLEQVCKDLKGKGFENVYTKTLTNEQVTTANIKAAKDFVKNAKPDDTFILFIAGHGMHDTDPEAIYYYLTHNTDLKNLKGTAATFETIEDLLQGIPPRNKLFLMDACESGELDPEDEVQYLASATEAGVNSRGFKKTVTSVTAIRQPAEKQSLNRSYLLNRNRYIYNDLVRRSGAIVFSSSKGGELSYERNDIENGLFTEYIMKALTTAEADKDGNGTVTTDELRKYVSEKVAEASGGLQHPTVDRDNIYQKFSFR